MRAFLWTGRLVPSFVGLLILPDDGPAVGLRLDGTIATRKQVEMLLTGTFSEPEAWTEILDERGWRP